MLGKTIQIYLPDGDPKGVKKASITTDKIKIIQIPRALLSENSKLLDFNGVYVLVDSLKSEKPEIYIGKGDVKSIGHILMITKKIFGTCFLPLD